MGRVASSFRRIYLISGQGKAAAEQLPVHRRRLPCVELRFRVLLNIRPAMPAAKNWGTEPSLDSAVAVSRRIVASVETLTVSSAFGLKLTAVVVVRCRHSRTCSSNTESFFTVS